MKQILRAIIFLAQIVALCIWCFYLGSIMSVFMLVVGFVCGLMGGGYSEFWGSVFLCVGHVAFLPFCWLYKKLYGVDKWYKSETFFGL